MEINYSYLHVPTIERFSDSNKFIRGLMGPFGSGKSVGCLIEILNRSAAQAPGPDGIRRTRWAVIRNTYGQLKDTTIKTVCEWLPPEQGFGTLRGLEKRPEYIITGFEGIEIELIFRALDNPSHVSNLLSLELTGAWVNEARDVPLSIIEALQGRVGRFPSMRVGGSSWHGIIMDTNPPDNDSWWYKLFEEKKPGNCAIFKQPSGLSSSAENIKNLPANYYVNLAAGKDHDFINVYVHGEYGYVQDGKPVYPDYFDSVHCTEAAEPRKGSPIIRGWDFGLQPACVFTQLSPEGTWVVFDELIADNMGITRFGDNVIEHCKKNYSEYIFEDYGDPAGQFGAETDESTCFQILQGKGIEIMAGEQTPLLRQESVKKTLITMANGLPILQLHPRCRMLRKGFQGKYRYRRMQVSNERYEDKPEKNAFSHPHDALQYIATRLFSTYVLEGTQETDYDLDFLDTTIDGMNATTGY